MRRGYVEMQTNIQAEAGDYVETRDNKNQDSGSETSLVLL